MRVLAIGLIVLGGCAPMMEMREGEAAEKLRAVVREFCVAQASGDVARVAAVFEPKLEEAVLAAGAGVKLASRAGATCEPGQVWYVGGSRRVLEVRRGGYSDRLDLWLSGQGRVFDLQYGDGGPTLRERLGVK